jgi:hypothetical protein
MMNIMLGLRFADVPVTCAARRSLFYRPSRRPTPRKVKKLDLLEFNDGCGMSRRSKKGLPELDVTRCYIGLETGA